MPVILGLSQIWHWGYGEEGNGEQRPARFRAVHEAAHGIHNNGDWLK
jgi:hypothetical protein